MNEKTRHIKNDYEFRRAYSKGASFAASSLVTYVVRRRNGGVRTGVTTGKKVGNAVLRNRARRVIREAFRELEPQTRGNWEIIFVARTKTAHVKMQTVRRDMLAHLTSAGVIPAQKKPVVHAAEPDKPGNPGADGRDRPAVTGADPGGNKK